MTPSQHFQRHVLPNVSSSERELRQSPAIVRVKMAIENLGMSDRRAKVELLSLLKGYPKRHISLLIENAGDISVTQAFGAARLMDAWAERRSCSNGSRMLKTLRSHLKRSGDVEEARERSGKKTSTSNGAQGRLHKKAANIVA